MTQTPHPALQTYRALARQFGLADAVPLLALAAAGPPASRLRRSFMAALEEADRAHQATRAPAPAPEPKP